VLARRAAALSGPSFVVLVLAGNSLTETVATESGAGAGQEALATFAAKDGDPVVAVGTAMELLGFVLLAVFAAYLVDLLRRRVALRAAGVMALVSVGWMLAVKLGSAAAYVAGLARHEELTPEVALALVEINNAAFVLGWLPWALFVGAAALSLRQARALGRVGLGVGLVAATLGTAAAVVGVVAPDHANPLPFLLGLVWVLVVGVRLAFLERGSDQAS
jgi:hypothetical protein